MQHTDLSSESNALSSTYEYKNDVQDCLVTDGGKESASLTACLSSVPNLNFIPDWNSGDEHKRLEFIKEDCLARLKDVRETN